MLAGAAMIASKFWIPVIPIGGAAGLLGVGLLMAFVPTLVQQFWLPFGIMLMIVAGVILISFVANWLGLRKNGLPLLKRPRKQATLSGQSKSSQSLNQHGIRNVNADYSQYLGGN